MGLPDCRGVEWQVASVAPDHLVFSGFKGMDSYSVGVGPQGGVEDGLWVSTVPVLRAECVNVPGCGHEPDWGLCSELQGRIGLWALSWGLSLGPEHRSFCTGWDTQGSVGSRGNDGLTEGVSLTLPSRPDQSQASLDLLLLMLWTLS